MIQDKNEYIRTRTTLSYLCSKTMGTLHHWKGIYIITDPYSLEFLHLQKSISRMHARWITFNHRFDLSGISNKATDAPSRKEAEKMADQIQKLHKEVKEHLDEANGK